MSSAISVDNTKFLGACSSGVEQLTFNQWVAGSIPARHATLSYIIFTLDNIERINIPLYELLSKPSFVKALERLNCFKIKHLYLYLPNKYYKREISSVKETVGSENIGLFLLKVSYHSPSKKGRKPYKIICYEGSQELEIIFFNYNKYQVGKFLPGKMVTIGGKVTINNNRLQIAHPSIVEIGDKRNELIAIEAHYPLTYGLTSKYLGNIISKILEGIPKIDWLPSGILADNSWLSWAENIVSLHKPQNITQNYINKLRERMAFDEIFAHIMAMQILKYQATKIEALQINLPKVFRRKFEKMLPFLLTDAQKKVLEEIEEDLSSSKKMLRLVQGDVGCGKTIVAFISALHVVESGYQAAIMVPSELLAKQHFEKLNEYCEELGIKITLLISALSTKEKKIALEGIALGTSQIIIGTHALFQEAVIFSKLKLTIIDEQHRFGVKQRHELLNKSLNGESSLLMLSATPIPRTLSMVNYADLDISIIDQKPQGRKFIQTCAIPLEKSQELMQKCQNIIANNEQIFWVCPLIAESEKSDLVYAIHRHQELDLIFPGKVGLIHSKLSIKEKDSIMQDFSSGKINILVSTTVIEVGIDIANATVMVIEHAERFGLSQLHQLRGRVGRNNKENYCILLYKSPIGPTAMSRINAMVNNNDGFEIAKQDLKLRGEGDLVGTKQSGVLNFNVFNYEEHSHLIALASGLAKEIMKQDPELKNFAANVRVLLELFDKSVNFH